MFRFHRSLPYTLMLLVCGAFLGSPAGAATIDISHSGDSTTVNGALIRTSNVDVSGEGQFVTFVRIEGHNNDTDDNANTEKGYNTSGRISGDAPFDDVSNATFTHNLQMSQVAVVTVGATTYYQFFLDINEQQPNGNGGRISLTDLQIYTSPIGSQTTTSIGSLGTLRYTLGTTDLLLHQLSSGGGRADYEFLIPISNFAGALSSDFLYLYYDMGSSLGFNGDEASSGFDGFAIKQANVPTPGSTIPLPGTVWMGLVLMGGIAARRGRRIFC